MSALFRNFLEMEIMMKKDNDILRKLGGYVLPGAVTLVVMCIILVFKGIWPFGEGRIDYYDNMQQVAPLYSHLWDVLHGEASLWFDWYTGLGTNVSMSVSAFSMLSPFNLLLFLVPRNLILESMSIYTVIKMVFMSVAMYAYIRRKFPKLSYAMKITFALMYAFCGYVLLYGSCFTCWMDIVAFFPLLMMGYDIMMEKGKKALYITMLALMFIVNYYVSAMALIYILFVSAAYLFVKCEAKARRAKVWNLGIGTACGLGLSAFVLVPVFAQLSGSQRGNSGGGGILWQYIGWLRSSVVNDGAMSAVQRWFMLLGMSFAIALIIVGLKKYWNDRKERNYNLLILGLMAALMAVEAVNLMWHFGSYCGYTLRNGFLVSFSIIIIGAYYAQKMLKEKKADRRILVIESLCAVLVCGAFVVLYNSITHISELTATVIGLIFVCIMTSVYIIVLVRKKGGYSYRNLLIIAAAEVFIGAYALIGPPKFYIYYPFQYGDYVQEANKLYDDFEIEPSATDRLTNPDVSLNANYPLIMKRGALSSFTAALQADTQDWAYSFGYSKFFWWLLDSGGTAFTEAMFHVTNAISVNELDSELYSLKDTSGEYKYYTSKYQLPFATSVNADLAEQHFGGSFIDQHNIFYNALMPDSGKLMTQVNVNKQSANAVTEGYAAVSYSAHITGKQAVYAVVEDNEDWGNSANVSKLFEALRIYINGKEVYSPTFGDLQNTKYTHDYSNNLLYMGCFEDETITVRVEYKDKKLINQSSFIMAQLSMEKMDELVEKYSTKQCETSYTNDSLTIKINGTKNENMAVVPVVYSDNFKITVNGKAVQVKSLAGLFTGVMLENGENEIVMTFVPKGKNIGLLITAAFLALCLAGIIIGRIKPVRVPDTLERVAMAVYTVICAALVVFMVIIPAVVSIPFGIYYFVTKFII